MGAIPLKLVLLIDEFSIFLSSSSMRFTFTDGVFVVGQHIKVSQVL